MNGKQRAPLRPSFTQMNAFIYMKTCGPIIGVIVFVMFDR